MKSQPPLFQYQLKASLLETDPLVWRRLLVRSDMSLFQLHRILQIMFGWTNSHLHEFRAGNIVFGESDPMAGVRRISEKKTLVADVLGHVDDRIIYTYDFGDDWRHDILLEDVSELDPAAVYPAVIAGARACPPEDVGGIPGYQDFLEAIADPKHPEHDDLLEWCGGSFDPDEFDMQALNIVLKKRMASK